MKFLVYSEQHLFSFRVDSNVGKISSNSVLFRPKLYLEQMLLTGPCSCLGDMRTAPVLDAMTNF